MDDLRKLKKKFLLLNESNFEYNFFNIVIFLLYCERIKNSNSLSLETN